MNKIGGNKSADEYNVLVYPILSYKDIQIALNDKLKMTF